MSLPSTLFVILIYFNHKLGWGRVAGGFSRPGSLFNGTCVLSQRFHILHVYVKQSIDHALLLQVESGSRLSAKQQTEIMDLGKQIENLEREVVTKKKETEQLNKDLDGMKEEALKSQETATNNFKTIFEEQDMALDAQVGEGRMVDP